MKTIKNNDESKKTIILPGLKNDIEDIKKKSSISEDLIILHFYSVESSLISGELTLDDTFISGIGDLHAIKQYLSEIAGEEVVLFW